MILGVSCMKPKSKVDREMRSQDIRTSKIVYNKKRDENKYVCVYNTSIVYFFQPGNISASDADDIYK